MVEIDTEATTSVMTLNTSLKGRNAEQIIQTETNLFAANKETLSTKAMVFMKIQVRNRNTG